MHGLVAVMAGGAIGAAARYAIGEALLSRTAGFPVATLIVNLAGGLAMGLLAGWLSRGGPDVWRLFLGVGVLGGFTTFSAFGLETVQLVERGALGLAAVYVLASLAGAVALTAAGLAIARVA